MLPKNICLLFVIGLASLFTSCVSLSDNSDPFVVLRSALFEPVDQLELQAGRGEAKPQYALAIVYEYGLRGKPRQWDRAKELKQKALAMRGYTTITQYIAGLNGKPGRSVLINTPRYDMSTFEAQINDSCAASLNDGNETERAVKSCGGKLSFDTLKKLWDQGH